VAGFDSTADKWEIAPGPIILPEEGHDAWLSREAG
jgi:hypothetical protein